MVGIPGDWQNQNCLPQDCLPVDNSEVGNPEGNQENYPTHHQIQNKSDILCGPDVHLVHQIIHDRSICSCHVMIEICKFWNCLVLDFTIFHIVWTRTREHSLCLLVGQRLTIRKSIYSSVYWASPSSLWFYLLPFRTSFWWQLKSSVPVQTLQRLGWH